MDGIGWIDRVCICWYPCIYRCYLIARLLHVGSHVLVVAHVDGHSLGGGVGAHLLQLLDRGRARLLEEDVRRARLDHLRWSSTAQCGAVRRRRGRRRGAGWRQWRAVPP